MVGGAEGASAAPELLMKERGGGEKEKKGERGGREASKQASAVAVVQFLVSY